MRAVALLLIRAYQVLVSPLTPQTCRFTPTCSEYAREALVRHGCAKGCWLSIKRIMKCHPFNPGGYDPVR